MRRWTALATVATILAFYLALPAAAADDGGDPLVADLSSHLIAITSGFSGTNLLLFGAIEGDGDVVMVIRGPERQEVLRRKDRQFGLWINSGWAEVNDIPSYYRVASSRPLADIATDDVLRRYQIGLDSLNTDLHLKDTAASPQLYRQALIRLKQERGLYADKVQSIAFLSRRLFRTDIHFPSNVPVGTYLIEVFLFDKGEVVSAQTTPLIVSKIGLGAEISDFARRYSAFYGMIAIVIAVFSGWLAAAVFRKH